MDTTALALVLVLGALFAIGTVVRGFGVWARRRRLTAIAEPDRAAYDIRVRATVAASSVLPGMRAGKSNLTSADLVLGGDRVILSSQRGLLVDVGAAHGRRLGSARCTGPGRLVLEGDVPRLSGDAAGWRMELALDDAEGWAEALRPFVAAAQAPPPVS